MTLRPWLWNIDEYGAAGVAFSGNLQRLEAVRRYGFAQFAQRILNSHGERDGVFIVAEWRNIQTRDTAKNFARNIARRNGGEYAPSLEVVTEHKMRNDLTPAPSIGDVVEGRHGFAWLPMDKAATALDEPLPSDLVLPRLLDPELAAPHVRIVVFRGIGGGGIIGPSLYTTSYDITGIYAGA